ncbi:MobQ family relaxase [Pseudogemmobacter faecipullorum]|uniref:MobA/MobL family protein n=1 Tax=Pseudogemmobacter faecipullorum TaxID=2755041 RepID=A0ABS8CS28_9RHOB|nr:MobA/MobL family protein [Pseudogemmobacter faecipullorum]
MAIYHLSAKVISRAGGRSSVAAAAYRSGGRLRDERQDLEHDYSRKGGVLHAEIMAPQNAPEWMLNRDRLWNAVEAVEKRRDAQLAREIEVALPRELDRETRLELLRGFVQREFVDRGMIADLAIHEGRARDGGGQPHAHVMLTMRELTGDGFGKKDRGWNAPDLLLGWREAWARDANRALEREGYAERIDHRSLEAQRTEVEQALERAQTAGQEDEAIACEKKVIELNREPEPKIGPAAYALEKRGIVTERGEAFRAAQARNALRFEFGWRQFELRLELRERAKAFITGARERLDQLWGRVDAAMTRIRERVMGEAERGSHDARRAAVLGREIGRTDAQAPDVGRERITPEDPERGRRDAVLGRDRESALAQRASDQAREAPTHGVAAPEERDRRAALLGRGAEGVTERGSGRDRDRGGDRER